MFQKFAAKRLAAAETAQRREAEFLEGLEDPLAGRTAWTPIQTFASSSRTHVLKVQGARAEFRPALGGLLGAGVFALVGGGVVAFSAWMALFGGEHWLACLMTALLFGAPFLAVGVALIRAKVRPCVFDADRGYFWRTRHPPEPGTAASERVAPLARVRALQLLREVSSDGDGGSTRFYELNLVLDDGSRVGVLKHGRLRPLRAEAEELADLLSVPLWDRTQLR